MSDIVEARNQLLLVAQMADPETAARIRQIVRRFMWRDKPVRRAPCKPVFISGEMKKAIKTMAATKPEMQIKDIAAKFNINQGRVSEILNGKR